MKVTGRITEQSNNLISFSIPALDGAGWCEATHDPAAAAAEWVEAAVYGCLGIHIHVTGRVDAAGAFSLETEHSKELLGFLIQQQRRKAGISVRELALRAGIKSHANVTHYEMGRSEPSFSKLQQLLGAMGVDVALDVNDSPAVAAQKNLRSA